MSTQSESPDEYTQRAGNLLANNYGPAPLTFTGADGAFLVTATGDRYLDFGSGISVTSFGQGHEKVRAAILRQMDGVWHTSNLFYTRPSLDLAAKLIEDSFAERVFFANSGAEANEAAIKLVRKAASATRPPEQRTILTFQGGFHGRTLATVTATAQPKYHQGFEPLPGGFKYCEFNNVDALRAAVNETVCAIMFEPVQGEGGVNVAQPEFVAEVRRLADHFGAYVIVDEVQSGIARTGKLWAHEWYALVPDVMTSAKALGGGLPIGAVLIGETLADVFKPGSHGSTFGGNPLCCAAANAVMELASSPSVQAQVLERGEQLEHGLAQINDRHSVFSQIRGRGLMLGAQLREPFRDHIAALVAACRDEGLLVLQAGHGVLRLLPPLTVTAGDVTLMLHKLERALESGWADKKEHT
ncbi:MAG: aspartate aminotransferase family protein [Gammaproteobacteria bacterium]